MRRANDLMNPRAKIYGVEGKENRMLQERKETGASRKENDNGQRAVE